MLITLAAVGVFWRTNYDPASARFHNSQKKCDSFLKRSHNAIRHNTVPFLTPYSVCSIFGIIVTKDAVIAVTFTGLSPFYLLNR